MKGVSPTDTIIPLAHLDAAMSDLLHHIRMIQDASSWLYRRGHHASATYFAILCMEESAKCHVLASCRERGEDVTAGDVRGICTHRERVALLLGKVRGATRAGGQGRASSVNYALIAAKLNFMKQLAVYYEYLDGGAITLEDMLGGGGLRAVSGHTQEIAALGELSAEAAVAGWREPRRDRIRAGVSGGVDSHLARLLELSREVPLNNRPKGDIAIPRDDIAGVLGSLELHVANLDGLAARLYESRHYEASILMSTISFEEANKHYMFARCRRCGTGVRKVQMEELQRHKAKLSIFFRDVSRHLGGRNAGGDARPPAKYSIIHPEALLKLNGLKELSVYFDHIGGITMTLRKILGAGSGDVALYLRQVLLGMVSWPIICDGDWENPYRIHNRNPAHRRRYEIFVKFRTNPSNKTRYDGMYWFIWTLDRLNDAVRHRDERRCKAILAQLQEHIRG